MKLWPPCVLFMLGLALTDRTNAGHRSDVEQGKFRAAAAYTQLSQQTDSSGVTSLPARSKLDCARICKKHRYCFFFSFDPDTGFCSLAAESSEIAPATSDAPSLTTTEPPIRRSPRVYEMMGTRPGPVCPIPDYEGGDHTQVAVYDWLRSLKANVTCDDNFTLGDNVNGSDGRLHKMVTLACSEDTAQWVPPTDNVQCNQSVWKPPPCNAGVNHPVPRTVIPGWRMCASGISDLGSMDGIVTFLELAPTCTLDVVLTFFNNTIKVSVPYSQCNKSEYNVSFERRDHYSLLVEALDEYTLNMTFSGDLALGQYTLPMPLSHLTGVKVGLFSGSLCFTSLDLWC